MPNNPIDAPVSVFSRLIGGFSFVVQEGALPTGRATLELGNRQLELLGQLTAAAVDAR